MAQQGYYPQRQQNPRYQQPAYQGPFMPQQGAAPAYMQNPQWNPQQQFKKSGAKYTVITKGKFAGHNLSAVNAWRKTKVGMMEAKCFPIADKEGVYEHTSQAGRKSVRYVIEISNSTTGTHNRFFSIMSLDTRKIYIDELGLVISPNGSGVTGTGKSVTGFFGKKRKK